MWGAYPSRRDLLAIGSIAAISPRVAPAQRGPRRIVIVGAGLAGLSAAYELSQAGHTVTILEARSRPGGRVYTLREPFADGLYAEAGAARIQDSHNFTLQYAKLFNLTLDPFWPTDGANITYIRGKRLINSANQPPDLSSLPLEFTPEERKMGVAGMGRKYIVDSAAQLGDVTVKGWPPSALKKLDDITLSDLLRQKGASPAAVTLLTLGYDLSEASALYFLRGIALEAATRNWYKIRGGNDLLPKALASRLSENIRYGAAVIRIEQNNDSVRAVYLRGGEPETISGDYLVCAIPLPVLRRVDISPALSAVKRAAIAQLGYLPMARVYLQERTRFWLARGESGWARSDHPMDVWDYTKDQPGKRGILGAYLSGALAERITYMEPAHAARAILGIMEEIHPGAKENFESAAQKSWIDDPWSMGAAVDFRTGQMSAFLPHLGTPEGRIHFAGEHTSPWAAWMQGALQSGNRVAREIDDRSAAAAR